VIQGTKKECRKCGLPQGYPGIKFNREGVCNYCIYFSLYRERENIIKEKLKKEILELINRVKRKKYRNRYDCIVAYSGGKDSSYLLYYLKEKFGLRILAHVLDNGFVSSQAFKNIKTVTHNLGIDCVITRPPIPLLKKVFVYALTERIPYPKEILAMMSQVCAVCLGMVFGTTLNNAIDKKIPLMFVGFTPGQYPAVSLENFLKVRSCMFLSDKVYKDDPLDIIKIIGDSVRERFGKRVEEFYFKSQYISSGMFVPKVLLPFHALLDYNEKEIIETISKIGWVRPRDTDACSTNCLINTLGNFACKKQLGYHPYIGELSHMVREGKMSVKDIKEATKIEVNSPTFFYSLEKLGLKRRKIR